MPEKASVKPQRPEDARPADEAAADTDVVTQAETSVELEIASEQSDQASDPGTALLAMAMQIGATVADAGETSTDLPAVIPTATATTALSTTIAAEPAGTAAAALARVAIDTGDAAAAQPSATGDQTSTTVVPPAEIQNALPDDAAAGQSPLLPNHTPARTETAGPTAASTAAALIETESLITATTAPTSDIAVEAAIGTEIAASIPANEGDVLLNRRATEQLATTPLPATISTRAAESGTKSAKKMEPDNVTAIEGNGAVAPKTATTPETGKAADLLAAPGTPTSEPPLAKLDHAAAKSSQDYAATPQTQTDHNQPPQTGFGGAHNQTAATVSSNAAFHISHLTAIPANSTPVPIYGLAVEIAANAQVGRSRFEIRLDPPELGRIDVRLDVDRQGQVTSHLIVERSGTLDLLRRDAQQLERALQDAGLKTSDNSLQFSLRDHSQSGRNDDSGREQAPERLIVVDEDTVAVETAGRSYSRMLGQRGGVDIRV